MADIPTFEEFKKSQPQVPSFEDFKAQQNAPPPPPPKRDIITGAALGGPNAPIGEQPFSPAGFGKTMLETGKGAAKELGSTAYNLATGAGAGPIGLGLGYLGKKLGITPKVEAATEPTNTSQKIGKYGAMFGEAMAPMPEVANAVPGTARAGRNLQKVMQIVGEKTPVDINAATPAALEAKRLQGLGSSAPRPMKVLMQKTLYPGAEPLGFKDARSLQTNLGELSGKELGSTNKLMKGQVDQGYKGLATANEAAADQAGAGDLYRSGINEYRQAKALQKVGKNVGKAAAGAAIPAAVGYGGYRAYRALTD
jgi:hypothetical protein